MDVIIFCGQSNMQGQSERCSDMSALPGAFEYKYLTDSLVPISDPVGEDITYSFQKGYPFNKDTDLKKWISDHIAGSSCYGNTSLVPSFAKAYTEHTKRKVICVHVAKGSTSIDYWKKGSPGYEVLIKKAGSAIKKSQKGRIFFVWLQGESDAIASKSKEQYKAQLTKLCDALMKDMRIEKFAIIRVGRFTNDARDIEIMSAQDEICRENSHFIMLTDIASELCKDARYMNPSVRGHYSAKGLEKLGEIAGSALAKQVKV